MGKIDVRSVAHDKTSKKKKNGTQWIVTEERVVRYVSSFVVEIDTYYLILFRSIDRQLENFIFRILIANIFCRWIFFVYKRLGIFIDIIFRFII